MRAGLLSRGHTFIIFCNRLNFLVIWIEFSCHPIDKRKGYANDQMTGHGFRSMASTLLNEQGWHRDAIERQLAHAERDTVRAAYNYAEHLPERKRMMQSWANYLDDLAKGADVLPIRADKRPALPPICTPDLMLNANN